MPTHLWEKKVQNEIIWYNDLCYWAGKIHLQWVVVFFWRSRYGAFCNNSVIGSHFTFAPIVKWTASTNMSTKCWSMDLSSWVSKVLHWFQCRALFVFGSSFTHKCIAVNFSTVFAYCTYHFTFFTLYFEIWRERPFFIRCK